MSPSALLAECLRRGVEVGLVGGGQIRLRPKDRVTFDLIDLLRPRKSELLAYLTRTAIPAGDLDPEITRRVAALRAQVDAWTAAGRVGVPPHLGLPGTEGRTPEGSCWSCREPLPSDRHFRCAACVAALERILRLAPIDPPGREGTR